MNAYEKLSPQGKLTLRTWYDYDNALRSSLQGGVKELVDAGLAYAGDPNPEGRFYVYLNDAGVRAYRQTPD